MIDAALARKERCPLSAAVIQIIASRRPADIEDSDALSFARGVFSSLNSPVPCSWGGPFFSKAGAHGPLSPAPVLVTCHRHRSVADCRRSPARQDRRAPAA